MKFLFQPCGGCIPGEQAPHRRHGTARLARRLQPRSTYPLACTTVVWCAIVVSCTHQPFQAITSIIGFPLKLSVMVPGYTSAFASATGILLS
jgi:hypothetical protein